MTRRRRALLGLFVAGTALLSACGGAQDKSGPVDLRMTVWTANKDQLAMFDQIAAEYRKSHPDIGKITFDPLPIDSYTTALTTQVAGGNPPDMGWIFEKDAPDFVGSGALQDLKPTLEKTGGYDYADIAPATTRLWQSGGKLYAYPFSNSPFGIFYNKDLLRKAGAADPDKLLANGKWTWDNAIAEGAKVTATGHGAYGLEIRDFNYQTWDNLAPIWQSFGAQAWTTDGATCSFDKPEMTQALTFVHDAIFKDKAVPPPGVTADFFTGKSAMSITQLSRQALLKDAKFKWGLVPLPSGPKGQASVIGQAGIGVFKKSKHAQASADFLAFFTNPANSAKLAQYFPPPRESQLNTGTLAKSNPQLTPEQIQKVVLDGIKNGVTKPSHSGSAQLQQTVRAQLDALWKPGADVQQIMGSTCRAIQPLLKQ